MADRPDPEDGDGHRERSPQRRLDGAMIRAEASYLLLETLVDEPSGVRRVGKYRDVFQRTGETLLIKERKCVYDTVIIDNCLVFPV